MFTISLQKFTLYLALNMSFGADEYAKRRFFPLPNDTALGIENIAATGTEAKGAWYTLSGVRLNGQPQLKGIYIRDGKKFIIK